MPNLAELERALKAKLDKRDTADTWRAGTVCVWSEPFQAFIKRNERVTVRPGESLATIGRECGGLIAVYDF